MFTFQDLYNSYSNIVKLILIIFFHISKNLNIASKALVKQPRQPISKIGAQDVFKISFGYRTIKFLNDVLCTNVGHGTVWEEVK